ncbi:MAG: c-type cytochrome, partial [Chloroflexota bacterium]
MNEPSREVRPGLARLIQAHTSLILAALAIMLLLPFVRGVAGQSQSIPTEPPTAAAGLNVHGERCANCHGPVGLGDGELAANLPNPPVAHGSLEYLRSAVPADMFDTVTNGRIPQGMPPFGPDSSDPLGDGERWDVIAAIYTFGTPIESVGDGRDLYLENCLSCHGEEGQGDGPDAGELDTSAGDLSSLAFWFTTSNQAVFNTLAGGGIAAHEDLADLNEEELWSVVDYMRTFSYDYTDSLAAFRPLAEATISGAVVNGTTGEPLAEESTALLRAFTQDLDITLTMTS